MACMNAFYILTQVAVDSFACEDKINELLLKCTEIIPYVVELVFFTRLLLDYVDCENPHSFWR